ncbi:Sodium-dependent dicarboxylate transporter SdcS [Halioglobus japonicus]|nr:Sodium-dependent dicarboxylate transporter SdcS [Halioglobus japonicus]
MVNELQSVLLLLLAAIVMFAINRPRVDAVALLMLVALPMTGVITIQEALAGFGNPNIVLIAAMFVIGDALARTGVASGIGDWLINNGGVSTTRLLVTIMLAVTLLGSVMSSTGVAAIFIPVILRISNRRGIPASRLMMPMAYAALISGMMTLVATSPNLVVNYEVVRLGNEGFDFFSFTPFGVPILIIGTLYMMIAQRWLDPVDKTEESGPKRPDLGQWIAHYGLADREFGLRVKHNSPLLGKTLETLDLPSQVGARIILVDRAQGRARKVMTRKSSMELQAGDKLLINFDQDAANTDIAALCLQYGVELLEETGRWFANRFQNEGLVEAIVTSDSRFAGCSAAELEQLTDEKLSVAGMRRGATAHPPHGVRGEELKAGDTLLLAGSWDTIRNLRNETQDLIVLNLPREYDEFLPEANRAPYALLTLFVVIVLMAADIVANVHAALIGCLMMGLFRCINLEQAYQSIQLKTLIMIVGMMPFALALDRTGGVDIAARELVNLVGSADPRIILATLYAATVLLGLFVVSTANAVLMIPVALAVAEALEASPYPFAMIIALAASSTFMTPISPINQLVATAGNYRFIDFLRIGLPLTLIVMVTSVLLVSWLLPFYPALEA